MKISPARTAAFDILLRIERDFAYSSVLLPQYESRLSEKDRGLCHELVLGVLRRRLYLDRIAAVLSKNRRLDMEVSVAIRLGLFQLIYLDRVPSHSAINESVNLAERARKSSAKGFVNGLLRTFLRERPLLKFADHLDRLLTEESHPKWLVERWVEQFGEEAAAELCRANNKPPPLAFRPVGRAEALSQELEQNERIRRSDFVPDCYIADRISHDLDRLIGENLIYFQDEGSQLAAMCVINVAGRLILDVCAAPGGKTSMIARATGALVVAGDIHFPRVERLRQTCVMHSVHVPTVQLDAEHSLPFECGIFDTVFVDAPCSGSGTIRHNPEIRYLLDPDDIGKLARKQLRILQKASELLTDGGAVVYSTCSLEREENEAVAIEFLSRNRKFSLERPSVERRFLTEEGFARTFPDRDGMDGFFIAVFRRN